ncbi:cell division protein ZapA [Escherichia coli]
MTPQQENALRSIARQANYEIKKARQQFPDKNVDDICRSVLKKHRETVTLMGFTPTHLSLAIYRSQTPSAAKRRINVSTNHFTGLG